MKEAKITTKEVPYLLNALNEKSRDFQMPKYALFIGAGCSYSSGIPLGGQLMDILKMECFKRDFIYNEESLAKSPQIKYSQYKDKFEKYLNEHSLEDKFARYLNDLDKELKSNFDRLSNDQLEIMMPPSERKKKKNNSGLLVPSEIETWLKLNKADLYSDYAYGFWFLQYSQEQKKRSELLETLIESRPTGYGYVSLANAIHLDFIRTVFTTNFDDLLNETLLQYFFKKSRVIAHAELVEHINFHNHNPNIIKLHGDYLFADLKNTQDEINRNALTEKMKDALGSFGLIVIGYGGTDYAIMNALEDAKNEINPYRLIWCDMKDPENLHWRVKHLLANTENSCYIKIQGFDTLMIQISDALKLKTPNLIARAHEKQKEFEKFYEDAKDELRESSLSNTEKERFEKQLTAADYFFKALNAETPDEKIALNSKAIALDPTQFEPYLNRGVALAVKELYDKAIDDYNEAIRLNPSFALTYNNRGSALGNKNRYDEAIVDYNMAIELSPDYAEAYNNRGLVWHHKGDYSKAIEDFNTSIKLKPNYSDAYCNLGNVYKKTEDNEKALANYNIALNLNPNDYLAYHNRSTLWNTKKEYEKAVLDARKSIELNVGKYFIYDNLSSSLLYQFSINKDPKLLNEAIEASLIAESLKNGSSSYNLACAYSLQNDQKKAVEFFEKALMLGDISREHIEQDTDLDNIRSVTKFTELLDRYKPIKKG